MSLAQALALEKKIILHGVNYGMGDTLLLKHLKREVDYAAKNGAIASSTNTGTMETRERQEGEKAA
jgi:hypothetical protein